MKDIALAPEYSDVIAIIIFNVILSGIAILLVLQKIHYTGGGQYMAYFWSIFMGVLAFAVLLAGVVFVVFWLVKSFLVKYFCDSGSEWGFRTVAAVTGYAYLPDIVIALIGAFAAWFLFPQMTFNLSDMEAAMRALADYQAQMSWIKLFLTLPLSVIGLFWKSYLGGLGARYGTKGKCTFGMGFAVFLVLGLVGLLISNLGLL